MASKPKISICIPSYQRVKPVIESFISVYEMDEVSEIIIVDDASGEDETGHDVYERLKHFSEYLPKVKLFRNEKNIDCFRNKKEAVSKATTEWVILLDSDNKIDVNYIETLMALDNWDSHTIYTPDFAIPHFDFRDYSGFILSRENISKYIDKPMLEVCLNAANYFINKNEWLRLWNGSIDPVTSDSIYVCANWLEDGNKIHIVQGLQYMHDVHPGSHYKNNVHRTQPGFHESILNKLRSMQ